MSSLKRFFPWAFPWGHLPCVFCRVVVRAIFCICYGARFFPAAFSVRSLARDYSLQCLSCAFPVFSFKGASSVRSSAVPFRVLIRRRF